MTPPIPCVYVDIDDCLANSTEAICRLVHTEFGKPLRVDDITEYDLDRSAGLNPEQLSHLLSRFHDADVLADIKPIPQAAKTVRAWHDAGIDVWIVTGRMPRSKAATESWFATHGIPWSKMVFVDKSAKSPQSCSDGTCMSLGDVARVPFALAIDDSPKMVAWLATHSASQVFLMDRPWNRKFEMKHPELASRVSRIKDFAEIKLPSVQPAR